MNGVIFSAGGFCGEHMAWTDRKVYVGTGVTREILSPMVASGQLSSPSVQLENFIDRTSPSDAKHGLATILTHLAIKSPLSDGCLPARKGTQSKLHHPLVSRTDITFNRLSPTARRRHCRRSEFNTSDDVLFRATTHLTLVDV